MKSEHDSRHPLRAGILIYALTEMKRLNLEHLSVKGIMDALEVSRSQAYEWRNRLQEWESRQQGPGRPKGDPAMSGNMDRQLLELSFLLRDWLLDHPGSACSGNSRTSFSDAFRAFVLELLGPDGPAGDLTREQAALVLGVSVHTLNHWCSADKALKRDNADGPAADQARSTDGRDLPEQGQTMQEDEEESSFPTSQWAAQAAQVQELWTRWQGSFGKFCEHLKHHGIHMSITKVANILSISGKRPRKKKRTNHPDPEAIRGELLRLFPNAQWNADGKSIDVKVDGLQYRFTMELVVDTHTTAHLGFSLREHEDSRGLLSAMDQATASAGEPPVAMLRDARACNLADAVETRLSDDGVISLVSTKGRPQNNSPVENAFSLLGNKLPVPDLPHPSTLTPAELGRLVMANMLLGVCIGRNHTPRTRLRGKTPAQAFNDFLATDDDKARAREELNNLRRRLKEQEQTRRLRCHPATLQLVKQAITDLGLSDPQDRFAISIARYGLEASTEAIACFRAKRKAGSLPTSNQERYLLGIARNMAHRNEDNRTYEALLDLRAKAADIILMPLIEHDIQLRTDHPSKDYRNKLLDLALSSLTQIDRVFWKRKTIQALCNLDNEARKIIGGHYAKRIAATQRIKHKERDAFIAEIAACVSPIAA